MSPRRLVSAGESEADGFNRCGLLDRDVPCGSLADIRVLAWSHDGDTLLAGDAVRRASPAAFDLMPFVGRFVC